MRALPVRRIATTTLCATLLLGTAGPAVAAAGDVTHDETRSAPRAPVPAPDALLAQVKQLADVGGVLTPVTGLLDAVLKADGNKLSPEDAKKHADAVKAAIDAAAKAAPEAPAAKLPATPEAPKLPAAPAVPKLPLGGAERAAEVPLDVKADALAALQSAVDALVKAATAGDAKTVLTQAPVVLTALVNVAVATLLSGGLPAPSLPGLPPLPKLPTGALPEAPKLPTGALPETPKLPTGALPQAPSLPVAP
ncbi:hypothetical protein [Streptomyces kanamyceticus]|uniref:Secreted protein n=1 Tax=Streptomyces kanamyceticus TaxID=1967 RepID=A0A5J6GKE3_STRKN|nr:hypothetical protein [Streptomyces kanamyceticus]QEU94288.1 hypothetical protein CP970_28315 [Streptomyces kanamyceticus]